MKKVIKKTKAGAVSEVHTTEDLARYIGSLHEDYQHKLSAVSEQVSGLTGKLDEQMFQVNRKLDAHTEMIGELAVGVATLKDNVKEIRNMLEEKADKKSVVSLEKRVSRVEKLQKA